SFREKWNPSNVGTSLKMHYKYEAAGCLWWTELFPQEQSLLVETSDNLDWASVLKFAEGLAMDKAAKDGMLMFDTTIACFLYPDDVAGQGLSDGFPACLPVLRAALLPAWGVLVALGQAILKQDWEHVRRLVEVTRSVRLRLHVVKDRVEAAKESIHYCEEFRKNALLQDTFVSWVGKFQTIWTSYKGTQKNALAWLRDQNVKYLNNDVNDAVLKAAKLAISYFDGPVVATLQSIQRLWGREAFNQNYTKLLRLMHCMQSTLKKVGQAASSEALLWVLQYTRMALRNGWLKLASLKADNLAESRSSKVLSWGQVSVLKWSLLCHLKGTLPGLTEDDSVSQDLVKVVDTCLVIPHFEALLPQKDVPDLDKQQELAVQAADDDADMPEAASQLNEGAELLQGFLNGLSSAGRAAGNLLFDLLQGDLENEFQAVWLGSENYEKTLKAILANEEQEEENSWTQAVSNLMSELELLHAQKTQADPTLGAPAPKLRELVRLNSDENGADQIAKCKKERETLWTSCVQHRSRTVRFLVGQKKNSMQLLEAIQATPTWKAFKPSNTDFILVIWSADLVGEAPKTPWQNLFQKPSVVSTEDTERLALLKSMTAKDKTICVAFDGRSKSWRKYLDEEVGGLWLVYNGRPNEGCVPSRQVFMSSCTREVAFVNMAFAKTAMRIQAHADDDLMEASTFYSHYSGLRFPRSLPKVRADVKQMILGTSESPSPEGWPSEKGLPLFWQEAKSSRFWKTFFANMGAKLIVDLEAGSGAAAVAAMEAGLSYIGICKSPEHQRVISNVVDSQSLKLITQQGHLLYNATLSESIHQLFKS
ncbi:Cdkl4, partial [Symbiodinium sp. CCMP2456]